MTVSTSDRNMMIGMLRQGKTAEQILNILNVIVPDAEAVQAEVEAVTEVEDVQVEAVTEVEDVQDEVEVEVEDVQLLDNDFTEELV